MNDGAQHSKEDPPERSSGAENSFNEYAIEHVTSRTTAFLVFVTRALIEKEYVFVATAINDLSSVLTISAFRESSKKAAICLLAGYTR